ncbi:MAG TPA: aminotransferase class V-fold PLP-dependent enzyme [Anaerolineae bacterium]|nr:aminotransferase class V-fold PLP-dependent enzyme [Anaerolineae bacterium]
MRDLFLLDPNVVFLNRGSFGACPKAVFDEYQRWQRELERQPVEFLGRRFNDLMREARTILADFVGADADEITYVTNATVGLNIVARSLDLRPGDEVLTTDHEYGALDRTWRFLCEKQGARYIRQPIPVPIKNADEVIEAVWSGVTDRTRVLFISHITSPTAIIFPIKELIDRAHERGIMTIIDGAHAVGQIDLNLRELGADFYSSNCHKWLMSPKGSAFLYARQDVQHLVEPLIVSWGWQSDRPGPSKFIDEQEWQGTRDIAAYLSVPAAIQFWRDHDWPSVRAACHQLVRYAREQVSALTGLPPLTPDDPSWFTQLSALPLPPCDLDALKRRLYDEFHIEIPVIAWNGRHFVRISVQGYNTAADVEALVAALRVLLPQVALRRML